ETLLDKGPLRGEALAGQVEDKIVEKYDACLPESILHADYARKYLDAAGAYQSLEQLHKQL
ncbi:MAG: hypothetical protein KJ645_13595, partial [Planctomycetes bacterium]|nr:hypothetical protein [Planctomycetota bacterium]